ncbi:MAG: membrane protein insertase YidC, partial [Gammaproteobacteria bacterium]|nr:membrane protein insertase YidC [Gammaproteobacteria bacterium]
MDIQRTLIWIGLAIVSYLMVLAWNDDYNTAAQPVAQAKVSPALEANAELQPEAGPASAEFATPEEQGTATLNAPAANLENASAGQIEILTDVLRIVIDRRGGNIVQADLLKYQETRESKQALTLLQQSPLRTYVTEASLIGRDGPDNSRNGPMPIYESAASRYELKDGSNELSVDLTHRLSNGVDIIKRYTFGRDRYKIDVSFHVHNKSENPWQGNFAGKLVRDMSADPTAQGGMGMHSFLGLVVNTPTEPYEKFDFADLEKSPLNQTVQGGWLAFLQHYFLSAWVPPADQTHQFQSIRRGNLHVMGFV